MVDLKENGNVAIVADRTKGMVDYHEKFYDNNYGKYETFVNIPDSDLLQKLRCFPEPIARPSADPTVQNFLNKFQDKDKKCQLFT